MRRNQQPRRAAAPPAQPGRVPVVVANTPVIKLPFHPTDAQRDLLRQAFPGYTLKEGTGAHQHGYLATLRKETETYCANKILNEENVGWDRVVDIGGSVPRHLNARRNLHCCNPFLTPKDAQRNAKATSVLRNNPNPVNATPTMCEDKAEQCNHIDPFAALSVHSLYYLGEKGVTDLFEHHANLRVMYAVVHDFKAQRGTFGGNGHESEARWERQKGEITMYVKGNHVPYHHNNMDWLRKSSVGLPPFPQVNSIVWNHDRSFGDMDVYVFRRVIGHVPANPVADAYISFDQAMAGGIGRVRLDAVIGNHPNLLEAIGEKMKMPTALYFRAFGHYFVWGDYDDEIILPAEAVAYVRAKVAGKVRSEALYQNCYRWAMEAMARLDLTGSFRGDICSCVATIAFLADVEQEYRMLNLAISPRVPLLRAHADLMVKWLERSFWWTAAKILGSALTIVLLFKLRQRLLRKASLLSLRNCARTGVVLAALGLVRWLWNLRNSGCQCAPARRINYADVCFKGRPLTAPSKTAHVTAPDVECTKQAGSVVCGPTLRNFHPQVSRQCAHNNLIAVNNRALMPAVDDEDHERTRLLNNLWAERRNSKINHQFMTAHCPWTGGYWDHSLDISRADWIPYGGRVGQQSFSLWASKYSASTREQLRLAHENYLLYGTDTRDWTIQAFVKRETIVKPPTADLPLDEPELYSDRFEDITLPRDTDFDPRLIQGRSDIVKVATGLPAQAFSKWLAAEWPVLAIGESRDHYHTRQVRGGEQPIYTSGATAEELGSIHACAVKLGYVCIQIDHSRWDAHQHAPALNCFHDHMEHVVGRDARVARKQMENRGKARRGVVYNRAPGTVKSGDGTTTCGNSWLHGNFVFFAWLRSACKACQRAGIMALIASDDAALYVPNHCVELFHSRLETDADIEGYKLKMSLIVDLREVTFCSGYFYRRPFGDYIFGPKAGRQLAKLFHHTGDIAPKHRLPWLRDVVSSMRFNASHVPVLGPILSELWARVSHVSGKSDYRPSAWKVYTDQQYELSAEAEEDMAWLYGCTSEEIHSLGEHCVEAIKRHGHLVRFCHPLLARMWARDEATRVPMSALGAFLRVLSRRTMSSWLTACVVSPIIEEWLKGESPFLHVLFGVVEAYLYYFQLGAVPVMQPFLHLTFYKFGTMFADQYKARVVLHAFLNCCLS